MYDSATTSEAGWWVLRSVRCNPRQRPPLPLTLPSATPLGYCGADRTHPKEAFYEVAGQEGDRVLRFRLYDAQAGEVRLIVNWQDMGPLAAGPVKTWTKGRTVTIPATALKPGARNVIGVVARGGFLVWHTWGVRDVTLAAP